MAALASSFAFTMGQIVPYWPEAKDIPQGLPESAGPEKIRAPFS
jgi:hypothetical protein